jgi:hypothetical protein
MTVILQCLCLTGFVNEANRIEERWHALLRISNAKPEPEYLRCFPRVLLEELANQALDGVTALGCRVAVPSTKDFVHSLLNEAWSEFWRDPQEYVTWEKKAIANFGKLR